MAAGRALVDVLGQGPHLGDAVADLLAQQHAAAAGLGPLAEHHLDSIGLPQVVGVHAVARGQKLIDQNPRLFALLRRHSAVAGRGARAHLTSAAAERLFGLRRQRAKAHPRDGYGDVEVDRVFGIARAQHHIGVAALAVAFQRIARHARAQKDQVVKMGHPALGSPAADIVDPGARGALDLIDDVAAKGRRFAQALLAVV